MSLSAPPEPSPAGSPLADSVPDAAPRRRALRVSAGWKGAFREFAIIVAGVLAALAAQAWWSAHQDRGREREYLRQLLADTRENDVRLAAAIADDETARDGLARLMGFIQSSGPSPPPDTIVQWMSQAGRASDFKPVNGTYRALIGTGDFRLIRTDSLRTVLTGYAASLDSEQERLEQLRGMTLDAVGPLARAMPFMRGVFMGPIDASRVDVEHVRNDPDVAVVLFTFQAANRNRLGGLWRIREETERLRRALEAEGTH